MAVQTEPCNDDEFKMSKDKPEESSIIRKDILWLIWTFFNVFSSETYETIKLFILHMLMSILKGRLQGRNLLGGKRWIIYLFLLCGIAPLAANADILGCSPTSRSRNDSVLDFDDVKRALCDGSTLCNFSHQGYEHVCEDAFHGMTCEIIDLTGNRLSNLPSTVFQNVVNLREVFLDGNMFVEMPELINDNIMLISINDNPFEQFSNNSTIGLPNLGTLSVKNCSNLSAIDEAAFENNLNLKQVRFSGTPLQKLPSPCSNCFNVTLEGPVAVHLMCGIGSDIVTFESERSEIFFLNKTVEMLSQTNDSITNRLICKTQANSETHSTTHTSPTPTSARPTAAILTSTPPTSVSTSPISTAAILTSTIGVVLILSLLILVWLYRKDIHPWCKKRSCISNQNSEKVSQNEP